MSVQISSLQVKALAKNLRKTMTYGYVSDLLQEIVTNPELVAQLASAIGKKKDKQIKQSSINKLVGAACGFNNYDSALKSCSEKMRNVAPQDDAELVDKLNSLVPPKNKVVFMEKNLPLFMDTFEELSEQQSMQLLLSDHFLFFDENNIYFRSNVGNSAGKGSLSGLIAFKQNLVFADLSSTVFSKDGSWTIIDESKSLPKDASGIITGVENFAGFLSCVCGMRVSVLNPELFLFRLNKDYELAFQKLKNLLLNDPLCPPFIVEDKFENSAIYTLLDAAIKETEDVRILHHYDSNQFLKLASMFVGDVGDGVLAISRHVALSKEEHEVLIKSGVLEDDSIEHSKPIWEIEYTLTLTEGRNAEIRIIEEPRLQAWDLVVGGYKKWTDGCIVSPRASKIIWDDLVGFLPQIEGLVNIINKAEFISKMSLITINKLQ